MNDRTIRTGMLLGAVTLLVVACNLFGGLRQTVADSQGTLEAAITSVQQGDQFIQTAQAIATQAGDSTFLATAQAMATELASSGFKETALAVVTQEAPGLKETANAVATQGLPAMEQTIQAIAGNASPNNAPEDIPLLEGEKENFYATSSFVSYTCSLDLATASDFYQNQMPLQGWSLQEDDSASAGGVVSLSYVKAERVATITLTEAGSTTLVVIVIEPQ